MSLTDVRLKELIQLKYDIVADLYRQRAKLLVARSKGADPLLKDMQGLTDFVGSLAVMLDPYWQLVQIGKIKGKKSALISTLFPVTPVPVNRTRSWDSILPFTPHIHEQSKGNTGTNNHLATGGYGPIVWGTPLVTTYNTNLPPQGRCMGFVKDTTWKSRNPGVTITKRSNKYGLQSQGEFELFRPYFVSYGPNIGYRYNDGMVQFSHSDGVQYTLTYADRTSSFSTPASSVNSTQVNAWPVTEKAYATGIMVKNLDSMLARCVPERRYFNLAYQVGELKDLPFTLRETLGHWRDLQHFLGRDGFIEALTKPKWWTNARYDSIRLRLKKVNIERAPDQALGDLYLNFKFGWQSMFQAAVGLVNRPSQITKEINYLIRRNGKFTKLSTSRRWTETPATFPSIVIPSATVLLQADPNVPLGYTATREISLRCMCDVGFHFPPLSVPSLRKKLFYEKLGLIPTPGDLYDLIPWTWMVDWFVGLGDYIHLMDIINGDNKLINYGFMSYKSKTTIRADWGYQWTSTTSRTFYPPGGTNTYTNVGHTRPNAKLVMEYELRLGLDKLASVKSYSGVGLSNYQSSILAALLTKFG